MNSKIIAPIGAGIAAVIIGLSIFAMTSESEQDGAIQPQTIIKNEKLGLVINPPTKEIPLQQLAKIYEDAAFTGIGRSNVYLFWDTLEPEKGEYNWEQPDILMSLNKKNGLEVTLYLSIINGKTLGPFPNWIGKPSLISISEDNLVNVLDAILSRYNIIDTVIIAGQTDEHFRFQEDSISIYEELFNNVYDRIKEKHPDVKIGNVFSLHNVINKNLDHIVKQLAIGDFVGFTYFPVDNVNEIVKTPQEARTDLDKIFELVPNKKVGFLEISWSTSDFVGGSEDSQVDFLVEAYDFYGENESKFEFFNWYRQYDHPEGTCDIQAVIVGDDPTLDVSGSGFGTSEFVIERLSNYICSSGLISSDGKIKPGWNEFKDQIQNLTP